ncbi:breast cancer anti-estrogen resistance protein 1-like [Centruroides vittatus]|uniref:breast cancer anti-estrogen resistance protein 1-like n=1 Tax=Centruroides vittatus TaxID=120091 RepID=UPI00350F9756
MLPTPSNCCNLAKDSTPGRERLNCLAKALYDNIAETPDELAFRKGDILTVLEQNTNDLEGWWLCCLRGRQGIAPGNRLRLIPGMYDPTGMGYTEGHSRRRSWQTNANMVVTPQKIGNVYLYDVPASAKLTENYDVPPTHTISRTWQAQKVNSFDNPPSPTLLKKQAMYNEPKSNKPVYDIPRSSISPFNSLRSHTPLSDNSSLGSAYDVPKSIDEADISSYNIPPAPRPVQDKQSYDVPSVFLLNVTNAYDIPPSSHPKYTYDVPLSQCSSGISELSITSSSNVSPSSSQTSLNLSMSSLCESNRSSMEQQPQELYDVPPMGPHRPVESDQITSKINSAISLPKLFPTELYDVPTNNALAQFYDIPPTPLPAHKKIPEGVYDVPPQVTRDSNQILKIENSVPSDSSKRLSSSSTDLKDFPNIEGSELRLELDAAMEMLVKHHQEVQSAMIKLFSFVNATWKKQEDMENKMQDIKLVCYRIKSTLQDFVNFVLGALANSMHAADKCLSHKLAKLTKPLLDSNELIGTLCKSLDEKNWKITLSVEDDNSYDELDQLVVTARNLVEDLRQVASFIQGNCTLIFKRSPHIVQTNYNKKNDDNKTDFSKNVQSRPLPPTPKNPAKDEVNLELDKKDQVNDYDYVNLESKEAVEKENEEIKASLPKELQKSFENLIKQSQIPVESEVKNYSVKSQTNLDPNDQQLLEFYGEQFEIHLSYLTNAIDAFLMTIESNQPPKVFIGHSKFVVISAHKLVYIGDTIYRNVQNNDIKSQVMKHANSLCDSLKEVVNSTKKAAVQFPCIVSVQEMVDSVVDVSHFANDLKLVIVQATKF